MRFIINNQQSTINNQQSTINNQQSTINNQQSYILFIIIFIILFFNFEFGVFTIAKEKAFKSPDVWSANTILDDLFIEDILGKDKASFFIEVHQNNGDRDLIFDTSKFNREEIINNIHSGKYWLYQSSLGFQTHILRPLFKILKKENYDASKIFRQLEFFVSIISSFVFAIFFTFLAIEFSILPVVIMFIVSLYTNIWITIFAKDIYWMIWSFFVPFLISSFFIYKYNFEKNNKLFFILFTLTVALRLSMGYEFISTFLISSTLPLFYFSISREYTLKKFIKYFIIISSLCFVALFIVLSTQVILLGGFEVILDRLYTRTINNVYDNGGTIDMTTFSILKTYLFWNYYSYPYIYSLYVLFIVVLLQFFTYKLKINYIGFSLDYKKYLALFVCSILSFIGSISNLMILKQHAYVHVHIDFLIFWIPTLFLVYLILLFKIKKT